MNEDRESGVQSSPILSPSPGMRLLSGLVRINRLLCGVMTMALVALVAVEVTARLVFNVSFDVTDEISGYLLVAIVFLSVPICLGEGALLRVDFIIKSLPERLRLYFEFIFDVMSLIFTIVFTYELMMIVISSYNRGMVSLSSLRLPLWIPQSTMPIGAGFLALALLRQILKHLHDIRGIRS